MLMEEEKRPNDFKFLHFYRSFSSDVVAGSERVKHGKDWKTVKLSKTGRRKDIAKP